jgi:hypothetical protein
MWYRTSSAPARQGAMCSAEVHCPYELECVGHTDHAATCELACAADSWCPLGQACLKVEELGVRVCRREGT